MWYGQKSVSPRFGKHRVIGCRASGDLFELPKLDVA